MSFYEPAHKTVEFCLACAILLAASFSGVVEIFTSAGLMHRITPFHIIDFIVYLVLIILTFLIYWGVPFVKVLYAAVAVIWYLVLIFFLPGKYGHELNLIVVFMQIIVTILAFFMLQTKN